MRKVLVGASSFGKASILPIQFLEKHNCEVILNPVGRKLTKEEVIYYAKDCDGILAGLEVLDEEVISALPKLKAITRIGIGIDNVDLNAIKKYNIKFDFTPDAPTKAVAEMTLAALLCLSRQLVYLSNSLHKGQWNKIISQSLYDKTMLIMGAGRIGKSVGNLAKVFVKEVIYYDPFIPQYSDLSLSSLLNKADILSIHVNGHNQVIGKDELYQLKDGAILLNPSRGGVVNEDDVCSALDTGKISGAWFDVFKNEPYNGKLTQYDQVLLTPHASSYTKECRLNMELEAAKKIVEGLDAYK